MSYDTDEQEGIDCPMCGGCGVPMGYLARHLWHRCRACGWEFFTTEEGEP